MAIYKIRQFGALSKSQYQADEIGVHVAQAQTGGRKCAYKIYGGKPEGKNTFRRSNVGGKNMLKWTFEKQDMELSGLNWLKIGSSGRLFGFHTRGGMY